MATLKQFAKDMRRQAADIPPNVADHKRRIAIAASTNLIIATPVDTGRARGNWRVGIGRPITSPTGNLDRSGSATINQNTFNIQGSPDDADIFISNNLPYIQRLNDGYSAQAPAGFVEKAIAAANAIAERAGVL